MHPTGISVAANEMAREALEELPEVTDGGDAEDLYYTEWHDPDTGARVAITGDELVILGGHGIHGMHFTYPPVRYPLSSIRNVKEVRVPSGITGVVAQIPGLEKSPCPKFRYADCAAEFAYALRAATDIPKEGVTVSGDADTQQSKSKASRL